MGGRERKGKKGRERKEGREGGREGEKRRERGRGRKDDIRALQNTPSSDTHTTEIITKEVTNL